VRSGDAPLALRRAGRIVLLKILIEELAFRSAELRDPTGGFERFVTQSDRRRR